MYFPGATADRNRADYAVVGAPLDVSTTFRPGTRFGPARVRELAATFEDYDHYTDSHFTDCDVYDHGDVGAAGAIEDAGEYLTYLEGELGDLRAGGTTPLLVGGEHTVTVAGVQSVDPDVFVCLDAHLDLREAYAGNPLSHSTVTRHALDVADRAVILGARAGSEAEWDRADAEDVTVVPPGEVSEWTPDFEDESVYLSVDVDAADPGFAPGTGTMEPFGLTPREMHDVVRSIAPQVTGFDVVEVNDRDDGQTATLAAKLLRAFVYEHAADDSE
ncbi:Agmatinase protein [Halorhabdus tiamatea SARL4B]|uniref:Agmatinase n=1 Tax=Halorhabdus tiamatea SARL4B TaxID=1033806 RepID=F7PL60_9EURY|nr:agmatinase [Halorhabdus tiamatea]ERJ05871.1 Agmatinase protein [Halorhabdus tiamatea SARL4B]CCQ34449.1 agmatinase [Halorhabdus tiamatea SARL4B]